MVSAYTKRNRYPRKRPSARIFLLLALPLLLLVLVYAAVNVLSSPAKETEGLASLDTLEEVSTLSQKQAYPKGALPSGLVFEKLLLEKSAHTLTAYAKGNAVRVYLVALGTNPTGRKEFHQDGRTPEGRYTINGKDAKSVYYKSLGISYPTQEEREHAARLGKKPGGGVYIHGLRADFAHVGSAHRITDWTTGCVALTNEEMDELYERTPVGTPIEITP